MQSRWPHVRLHYKEEESPDVFASKYIWLFHKWWTTFRGTVAYISIVPINPCLHVRCVTDYTRKDCRPSVSGEISQKCTQCFIHPTLGGKSWKTSQAAHIDYPLENVGWAQYVKLLRNFSFLWWFISLTSLSIPLVQPSRPPSSLLSLLFPPIQPFSSCHPWAGGLSLREVKGHHGWEGSRQVVRAPCLPFPTAHVKCCWTLTPVGPHSENQCGTQFSQPDPIQGRTHHWVRKKSPPIPIVVTALPFVCWPSRVGRPAATSQDKTSEKPIQHVIWPPGSIADSQGSNAGNPWGFSSMEFFHPLKWTLLTNLEMTNDFF